MVVDVHAEATSEKVALARWLDGRVTAVLGTHTHVQTSDARVLPGGTAAITDVGMTGPHDSVIGVEADLAIQRMRTGMPVRFETAQGGSGSRARSSTAMPRPAGLRRSSRCGSALTARRAARAAREQRSRTSTSHEASGSKWNTSDQ